MNCPMCRQEMIEGVGDYNYGPLCGPENVVLKNITLYECPKSDSDGQVPGIPAILKVHHEILWQLMSKRKMWTEKEIGFIDKELKSLNATFERRLNNEFQYVEDAIPLDIVIDCGEFTK